MPRIWPHSARRRTIFSPTARPTRAGPRPSRRWWRGPRPRSGSSGARSGGAARLLPLENRDREPVPIRKAPAARLLAGDDPVGLRHLGQIDLADRHLGALGDRIEDADQRPGELVAALRGDAAEHLRFEPHEAARRINADASD